MARRIATRRIATYILFMAKKLAIDFGERHAVAPALGKGHAEAPGKRQAEAPGKPRSEDLAGQLDLINRKLRRALMDHAGGYRSQAAAAGITPAQQHVLMELVSENGLSMKTLSGRMGLSNSTVSGIVDRLELKKMVYRKTDPVDRRVIRVYLSEPVRRYIKRAKAGIYAPLIAKIETAPVKVRKTIADGLLNLCELLEKEE